jgi:hypothetical protein
MRDNLDSNRDNHNSATSAGNSEAASRRRGSKLDLLKAAWKNLTNSHSGASAGGQHGHPFTTFLRRHLALIVLLALLVFPVGAIVLGYITRPAGTAGQAEAGLAASSTDNGGGEKKAKPAPGKPMLSNPQAPPPVVISQPPAAMLEPQAPDGMASMPARPLPPKPGIPSQPPNTPPPGAPAIGTRPPYTPLVYTARHDKVFGEGCSGQLTLDGSGLVFQCADDPRASVHVALNDIESVDGNGIRLISGKKYHFSIAGMAKNNAEQLFANWLQRVR